MKTTNLSARTQIPPMFAVILAVFVAAAGIVAVGRLSSPQARAAAVPTMSLPVIIIASPTPAAPTPAAVVAAVLPSGLPRALVAYDAPGGNVLGAIEQGRAYRVLARYGADWLQADVTGSGAVWLRTSDVLDIPAKLVDLQPTAEPAVIYVAAAPAQDPPTPDWYNDIATPEPAFLEAVIGDDPDALACGGSPLCGGLTNAQARAAVEER